MAVVKLNSRTVKNPTGILFMTVFRTDFLHLCSSLTVIRRISASQVYIVRMSVGEVSKYMNEFYLIVSKRGCKYFAIVNSFSIPKLPVTTHSFKAG